MSRKMTAALFVAVWLSFFSLEFIGVFGPHVSARTDITASLPAHLPTLTCAEITEAKINGDADQSLAWCADFITVPVLSLAFPNLVEIADGDPRLYEFHRALRL